MTALPEKCLSHLKEKTVKLPNVTGFSQDLKPRIRKGKEAPREQVVRVYVARKLPREALTDAQLIPGKIEGVPTDVVEIGELKTMDLTAQSGPGLDAYAGKIRPVTAGWSCGNEKSQSAGTIGCIVSVGSWEGILSNNHVLARCSNIEGHKASRWEGILQPGVFDGGKFPDDFIAFLYKWTDLSIFGVNRVDRAIALFARNTAYRVGIQDIGLVRGLRQAEVGLDVQKTGRTSGREEGKVIDTNAFVSVSYGEIIGKALDCEHQILIAPSISAPGDSGSLVTSKDSDVVGHLFAGSPQVTVANHIADSLEGLGAEIVGSVGVA